MKPYTLALVLSVLFGLFNVAKATVIFDIYDVVDDFNLGYIEFVSGGELSDISDVLDFSYTSKIKGKSFTEADITDLNVLIDEVNGELCWGDWAAGLTTINPAAECGRQTDPLTFAPYGLEASQSPTHWLGFWGGGKKVFPSRASDAGDDDEDLYFVMRSVPEPATLILLATGLLGFRFFKTR